MSPEKKQMPPPKMHEETKIHWKRAKSLKFPEKFLQQGRSRQETKPFPSRHPLRLNFAVVWCGGEGSSVFCSGCPRQAERYAGRIKSYNAEKGFGFIECAIVHGSVGWPRPWKTKENHPKHRGPRIFYSGPKTQRIFWGYFLEITSQG